MKKLFLVFAMAFSAPAFAYDCNSDCHAESRFRYPCPTWRNPGRKCWGKNWAKLAACESAKAASCKIWNAAVDFFAAGVKPILKGEFNSQTWAAAEYNGEQAQYMAYCTAAAAAACTAYGAEVGGPHGAVLGGAGGTFVSYQICKQSTKW